MRFLTFRFDDGLIRGAHKAARALAPDKASFFVLSRPEALSAGPYAGATAGLVFGTREDWVRFSAEGHDIQPHSATHPDFRGIASELAAKEVVESTAFVRAIHTGPYVFAYPFNRIRPDFDLAAFGLDGAGFQTTNSAAPVSYNRLGSAPMDRYRLRAWEVHPEHYDAVVAGLDGLPAPSWTILSFHSFDGEGWKPWTSEAFVRLVAQVRKATFTIVTVREMWGVLTRKNWL